MSASIKRTFYANNTHAEINIKYTSNKNMYLKVKNGEIFLTIPHFTSEKVVEQFVAQHLSKFIAYISKKESVKYIDVENSYFYLFGTKVYYETLTGFTASVLQKKGSKYYLQCSEFDKKDAEICIINFLKAELEKFLVTHVRLRCSKMLAKDSEHKIIVSAKESAWATNFIGRNKISFALKLAHFNKEIIDYIVVHELSHDIFPNHSNEFWKMVETFCPNFRDLQNSLKNDQDMQME